MDIAIHFHIKRDVLSLKRIAKYVTKQGIFQGCVERNRKKELEVHAVEWEYDSSESDETHTSFCSIEMGSVLKTEQSKKGLISVKIARKEVKLKASTGAEATVIPYNLYKIITNKPLKSLHQPLKGRLATKPIYPKRCVRLPTQHKGRKIDFVYLVVDGVFTPLLGYEACLDLKVLQFLDLLLLDLLSTQPTTIDSSRERSKSTTTLASDPVLKDYLDCFSTKPGMLPSKAHLLVDSAITPVVHPPRKIPVSMLDLTRQKLREMEEDGIIVKEEEHMP